jgi:colicin import membrane protein
MAEMRTKSLEETVARPYEQIDHLSNRLEEAKKQVQDIALKAIESSFGARALSHVNQIAMEQAKTRGTSNQ